MVHDNIRSIPDFEYSDFGICYFDRQQLENYFIHGSQTRKSWLGLINGLGIDKSHRVTFLHISIGMRKSKNNNTIKITIKAGIPPTIATIPIIVSRAT